MSDNLTPRVTEHLLTRAHRSRHPVAEAVTSAAPHRSSGVCGDHVASSWPGRNPITGGLVSSGRRVTEQSHPVATVTGRLGFLHELCNPDRGCGHRRRRGPRTPGPAHERPAAL